MAARRGRRASGKVGERACSVESVRYIVGRQAHGAWGMLDRGGDSESDGNASEASGGVKSSASSSVLLTEAGIRFGSHVGTARPSDSVPQPDPGLSGVKSGCLGALHLVLGRVVSKARSEKSNAATGANIAGTGWATAGVISRGFRGLPMVLVGEYLQVMCSATQREQLGVVPKHLSLRVPIGGQ